MQVRLTDNITVGTITSIPIPVFLDVNGDSQVVRTETVLVTILTSCSHGEVIK